MEINPQLVVDAKFTDSERALFDLLKEALEDSANPETKGAKLAGVIKVFFERGEGDPDERLWGIWSVIIDIVRCVPPDHPWQDSLVQSLHQLRQQDGAISQDGKVRSVIQAPVPDTELIIS